MNSRKWILVFGLVVFLSFPHNADAKIVSEDRVVVGGDEVVEEDLFVSGETVMIQGTVKGDVYAVGGEVIIDANVEGDISAAGGQVNISGTADDVQVAGGNVSINNAQIEGSLRTVGGNVYISEGTNVGGGFVFAGGMIDLKAPVEGSVTGGAGTLTINSMVAGNVRVGVGTLRIDPGANIEGSVTYSSEEPALISDSASIAGEVVKLTPKYAESRQTGDRAGEFARFGFQIWSFFASLIAGIVLIKLLPKFSLKTASIVAKKPWASLGWGFAILILTIPALILVAITVVGLPIAVIGLALFAIDIYISKIFVAMAIGEYLNVRLKQKSKNEYLKMAAGLALIYILTTLPIIRFFVSLIVLLLGMGAIIQAKREYIGK